MNDIEKIINDFDFEEVQDYFKAIHSWYPEYELEIPTIDEMKELIIGLNNSINEETVKIYSGGFSLEKQSNESFKLFFGKF